MLYLFQKICINKTYAMLVKLLLQISILLPILLACRPGLLPRYVPPSPLSCSPCEEQQGDWISQVVQFVIEVFLPPSVCCKDTKKISNKEGTG